MTVHFQREMEGLRRSVLSLGARVETAIDASVDALVRRDEELARSLIRTDAEIDRMEVEVEEECLKLLALYQPVAGDLRLIIAVLKLNNDLERIGDLAANIAKGALRLVNQDPVPVPPDFPTLSKMAKSMVRRSLDALVNGDADLARQVCADDDLADALRLKLAQYLKTEMARLPGQIEPHMTLFMCASNLERIADAATNIAEDVIYLLEGRIVRHGKP
jgi:phosphate transport system protein